MARQGRSKTVGIDIPSYANGNDLCKAQAGRIFLSLRDKTYMEVAYEFGLDRFYSTPRSMTSAIARAVIRVLDNPMAYGVTPNDVIEIRKKTAARAVSKGIIQTQNINTLREQDEAKKGDIVSLVTGARDLASSLLLKRLQIMSKSSAELKKEGIVALAKVVGILVDKGQILRGEATQNMAVLSRHIKSDISPEDALRAVIETREVNQTEKEEK